MCDASASAAQSEIDERVAMMFELKEPALLYDLRHHYGEKTKYDKFCLMLVSLLKKISAQQSMTAGIQRLFMSQRPYLYVI